MTIENNPTHRPESPVEPPATAAAPQKEAAPPTDAMIHLTSEQLNERLERERRSFLKKLGFENEQQLKDARKEVERLSKEAEERRRAEMSEMERYRADLEAERASRKELEERMAAAEFERRVTLACAKLGVTHIDYAMFEIQRATESLPDGEQLDVVAHLKGMLDSDPAKRAALGVAAPVQEVTRGATTTIQAQEPHAPLGQRPKDKDAFSLSPAEWHARRQALGIR